MTALVGIIKKELKVAFTTPIAYVVFFAFTLWSSIVFYRQLLAYEDALQRSRHLEDTELLALLNFNDFASSFITLFTLMVINNWFVTTDMLCDVVGNNWPRVFTITFILVVTWIMLSVIIAFVLEIHG